MRGQKHLIECNCILPQFRRMPDPPFHKFVVFSIINDDGSVQEKRAQCPNCSALHIVTDLCASKIAVGRDSSNVALTIDDVKSGIAPEVRADLEKYDLDLATWEQVAFAIDKERWGEIVILVSETVDGAVEGKYAKILGRNWLKIEPFERKK